MNQLTMPTLYVISDLVHVRCHSLPTKLNCGIHLVSSLKFREFHTELQWSCYRITIFHLAFLQNILRICFLRHKNSKSPSLISRPRKYFINPKFVISNSHLITSLKYSTIFSLFPMKIRSST